MDAPPPARLLLALVILGGLFLASGAVLMAWSGDPVGHLFRQILTIQVILGLVAWNIFAWTARRLIIGKLDDMRLTSMAALIWGGFRVALFVAVVTIIVCGAVAWALGLETVTAFVRALVLIVIVTAFTGIFGGALFNSLLVVRRLRERPTQ
jgi:hypothetical protein